MMSIARFMNFRDWVDWAQKLIGCYDSLDDKMKNAYAFILDFRNLVGDLHVCTEAIAHVESLCKNYGFGKRVNALCQDYIIRNVIGNANNRRASVGLEMLDYFKLQAVLLSNPGDIRNISSDIIESDFGIFKAKKSPNKLCGITSQILILPLYPKTMDFSVAENQNFKVRLANVKLKYIALWAKENLSENLVGLRSKTLNNAS